jgi:signal transduction histidine kinase
MKSRSNIPLLLLLLFTYILAQLGWWAFLITQLTNVVYADNPKLDQRVWMVWGEGLVFALILFIGFIFTYKAYLKELYLARQQKNFLLSVTHELKTPVASLKLLIETLQARELNEEQKKIFLNNALSDTDRLNVLIENILQSAHMDSGNLPIHKTNVNVSNLIIDNLNVLKNSIGKNHRFQFDIAPNIFAEADQQALVSILINLVDNAVKYSPKDAEISVKLFSTSTTFQLIVSDQGQGIKKEDRKKIFEKFIRIQNEETRSTKGTGLGLYIVSNLVNSHHGKIDVSDNSTSGSVFTIEIPLK